MVTTCVGTREATRCGMSVTGGYDVRGCDTSSRFTALCTEVEGGRSSELRGQAGVMD